MKQFQWQSFNEISYRKPHSEIPSRISYIIMLAIFKLTQRCFFVSQICFGSHFFHGCQRVGMPGLGSRLSTCCPTKRSKWRCSQHTSADQTPILLRPHRVTGIQTKMEGVRVCEKWTLRHSQTGQAQLGLNCKASKCGDCGTGDLGVLPTHETSLMKMTPTRSTFFTLQKYFTSCCQKTVGTEISLWDEKHGYVNLSVAKVIIIGRMWNAKKGFTMMLSTRGFIKRLLSELFHWRNSGQTLPGRLCRECWWTVITHCLLL